MATTMVFYQIDGVHLCMFMIHILNSNLYEGALDQCVNQITLRPISFPWRPE
jgi:hypothetical protein